MSADGTYAFDNALAVQRERLDALEGTLDPGTVRVLADWGVAPGSRCLEVGSVALWLCERVGPDRAVLATDLDVTLLRALSHPRLEVRVHDVLRDPLPTAAFDLIHCRLVLAWLPDPPAALRRLVAALKPGGRLVAEEMDFVSAAPGPRLGPEARDVFARVAAAHNAVLARRHSFDPFYGRRAGADLEDAGLVDVMCEGRASMWRAGEPGGRLWPLTLAQLREELVDGLVTAADVARAIALWAEPGTTCLSPIVMAASGRRFAAG